MGASNVLAAYRMWGEKLPPKSMLILIYMAATSLDSDESPWFGRGHEHLAEHALFRPPPITAADSRAVERAMTPLLSLGAIVADRKASVRRDGPHTARYRLALGPCDARRKLTGVNDQDSQRPTKTGTDARRFSDSRPTKTDGERSSLGETEEQASGVPARGQWESPNAPSASIQVDGRTKGWTVAAPNTPASDTPRKTGGVPSGQRPATEAHRIIADALPSATPDEVDAVLDSIVSGRFGSPPGIRLLTTYAREGVKLPTVLAEIRQSALECIGEEIRRVRTDGPECAHRMVGGESIHPLTGKPLCPQCAAGVVAAVGEHLDPDEQYARFYVAHVGRNPPRDLLNRVARQSAVMTRRGIPVDTLSALILRAALADCDLIAYVSKEKNRAQ
jgi:hypothetical protein